MNTQALWDLLLQIGSLILVPVAGALGALWVQRIKLQSLNIKGKTWETTKMIINTVTMSAQQQKKTGKITDKKEYAMKVAKKMLESRGIKVDEDILSEMIEAQVWDSFNSNSEKKEQPSDVVPQSSEEQPAKIETDLTVG